MIIVYPPTVPWSSMQQTPHRFCEEFAKLGYTVYFCDAGNNIDKSEYKKRVAHNLYVCSDYNRLKEELKHKEIILYISWGKHHTDISYFTNVKIVIYHYLDDFSEWEVYQSAILKRADIVIATADKLYKESAKQYANKTFLINNGCDYELFNRAAQKLVIPDDVKNIKKPIVFYHGAIASWMDMELVDRLSSLLPEFNFVFIGIKHGASLPVKSNIYYLGEKEYKDLINYLSIADICIIPFKINRITQSTNPIKVYEYLAAGKPIVSTSLPELKKYEDMGIVSIGLNAEAFAYKIKQVYLSKELNTDKKLDIARKNSWCIKVKYVNRVIDNFLNGRPLNSRLYPISDVDISISESSIPIIEPIVTSVYPKKDKKSVAILTRSFFDYDGKNVFMGGGERYLTDLYRLLKKFNYDVAVYQHSHFDWKRVYKDINVIGISGSKCDIDSIPDLTKRFNEETSGYDNHLYFSFDLCYPDIMLGSLAISHGIPFDGIGVNGRGTQKWYDMLRKCVSSPKKIITVDTNTINWARASFPDISDKFIYIPNYVDTNKLIPTNRIQSNNYRILFPRRIIKARGWEVAMKAVDTLAVKYPNMTFSFVGKGFNDKDESYMKEWCSKYKNATWDWVDMDNMVEKYSNADLVIIPTLWSEGTSLSCLEAMASGIPIITTCVGGLTDLIINNYNGILLEYATPDNLINAIEDLYFNQAKANRLGMKAREVAEAFNKERWEKQWIQVIQTYLK